MRIATTMTTRFDLNARRMDSNVDIETTVAIGARGVAVVAGGVRGEWVGGAVDAVDARLGAKRFVGESRRGCAGVAGVHETKEAATVDGATRVVRGSGAVGERARVY